MRLFFLALVLLSSAAFAQNQVSVSASISTTTCLGTGKMTAQETGCIVIDIPIASSVNVQIGLGWQGGLAFEGTQDSVTWYPVNAFPQPGGLPMLTTNTPGMWEVDPRGSTRIRVRALALDSGTPVISMTTQIGVPPPTIIGMAGVGPNGQQIPFAAVPGGAQVVFPIAPPLNPFLPRCNAVRTTQCQP